MPASEVRRVGGAPYAFPFSFYGLKGIPMTPQQELVMNDMDRLLARGGGYPREMVPDLSDAALAMRETIERDKTKAKARKARREFASDLLWKAVNGLGVLVLLAIVGFVALWLTVRPAAAGEVYYRYACGTYTCTSGFRVLSPARTIPSTARIIETRTQHWSSIYAPGYSVGSRARPLERAQRPLGGPGVAGGAMYAPIRRGGGGGAIVTTRPKAVY